MKEIDVHNIIEARDKEGKAALFEKVQQKTADIPVPSKQVANRKRTFKLAFVALACICVVCLAIILPVSLKKHNDTYKPAPNPNPTPDRYYHSNDCVALDLDITVKDYAQSRGIELLFLNWYDNAEDVITAYFVNAQDPDDLVYIEETLLNGDTGDKVILYITDNKTQLEDLQASIAFCINEYRIGDTVVKWCVDTQKGAAWFEYNSYRYYLELQEPVNETDILDIVESMF